MCCFSQPINDVTNTNIFARMDVTGRQTVVYNMKLDTPVDVSMILPIPVKPPAAEDAVKFIDLSGYPTFFNDLAKGFPVQRAQNTFGIASYSKSAGSAPLEVQKVGSFDASFVPTIKDFSRLSPQFRLPAGTWESIPAYKFFGFAVFKLRKGSSVVHPMAFTFPTAVPKDLFFPTMHIHDRTIHPKEVFHHTLYCQVPAQTRAMIHWVESPALARTFVDVKKTAGIIVGDSHIYRMKLDGLMKNQDTVIAGA